jgi:DNA gyrase/topoisomerase IV subunit A
VVGFDAIDAKPEGENDADNPGVHMLVISQNGFGKRTELKDYPQQGRGGSGVITLKITDKTGPVVAAQVVQPGQGLMLISQKGIVIRTEVDTISIIGRSTQGVTVMRLEEGDQVVSIACFSARDNTKQLSLLADVAGVEIKSLAKGKGGRGRSKGEPKDEG